MMQLWQQIVQAVVMAAVLPGVMFSTSLGYAAQPSEPEPLPPIQTEEKPTQPEQEQAKPILIPVLKSGGTVQEMELEEYIGRVVLGEISADFEMEAIKAQAVAARTYTLRCIEIGKKHPQGAVCTDYRCCQAYKEPEAYLKAGGTESGLEKIFSAVEETAGQVLCYDGELINATYFASSGGVTEDAAEVWGQAYPYLQSVASPGEEDCGYFEKTVSFTAAEFQEKLGTSLSGSPGEWFGMVTYTASGGVDLMRIGGQLYTGVELRRKLELRSTVFSVDTSDDVITFTTKGYGHRVGMSQHGADAMAVSGSTYEQILTHYYQGTMLESYNSD